MKTRLILIAILFAMILVACANPTPTAAPASVKPKIEVSDLWVRPVAVSGSGGMGGMDMGGPTSAAYMVLKNSSGTADRLIKAQTDVAKSAEIHTTIKEGDVMKMRQVEGVDIPANGQAKLEPGGFHVMLIGVTRELKVGDKIKFTLVFEKFGSVELEAKVRAQ